MALTKCKECSHEISTGAKSCPHCGAKIKKPVGVIGWLLVLLVGFFVYRCTSSTMDTGTRPVTPATRDAPTSSAPATPMGWSYTEQSDSMTSKTIRFASVDSTNVHQLAFPYHGGTRASLTIRQHPRYGKGIIFEVNKGQILCTSYDGCTITVRFDERPAIRVHATEPSDHSSTTLFLSGYDSLLTNIRKSKKVAVEVEFYQEGPRSFQFDVANLNWK